MNNLLKKHTINDILFEAFNYIFAIFLGFLVGALLILWQGENPFIAYKCLLIGSIGSIDAIAQSIRWSTPAILAGLATCIGFRIGVFNMGVEGQLYMGAFVSAIVGYAIPLPAGIHPIIGLLAGCMAGGLYVLIPTLLWLKYKVNIIVNTLMMNYIAILFTEYITKTFLMDTKSAVPRQIVSPNILESARLPQLIKPYQANLGFIIALMLAVVLHVFYTRTSTGYDINMIGKNPKFAEYGGVPVIKLITISMIVSGCVGGLTGAVETLGVHRNFKSNFSINLGFDGVLISLLAKNNPLGVVVAGLFWGMLKSGAFAMERTSSVSRIIIQLVQALFVLFLSIDSNIIRLKIKQIKCYFHKGGDRS